MAIGEKATSAKYSKDLTFWILSIPKLLVFWIHYLFLLIFPVWIIGEVLISVVFGAELISFSLPVMIMIVFYVFYVIYITKLFSNFDTWGGKVLLVLDLFWLIVCLTFILDINTSTGAIVSILPLAITSLAIMIKRN